MPVRPGPAGGGATSSWTTTWDVSDASAVATHDMTDNAAYSVSGVNMTLPSGRSMGTGGSLAFDGTNGLRAVVVNRLLYNANTAPIIIFNVGDAVEASGDIGTWDPMQHEVCFQWRMDVSGSISDQDFLGAGLAQVATPTDTQFQAVIPGQLSGNPYFGIRDGVTTSNGTAPATAEQTFGEIRLLQGNVNSFRVGQWPGSWPDPSAWSSQGLATNGVTSQAVNALNSVTQYTGANAHIGLHCFRNSASGSLTVDFLGWRMLAIVPA